MRKYLDIFMRNSVFTALNLSRLFYQTNLACVRRKRFGGEERQKNDENNTWVEHCLLCLHGVVGLDGCSPICF